MNKAFDLKGKKFNRLTVISRQNNYKDGSSKWLCQCDCGNKVVVLGGHLRSGHTKSCGCLQKEICKAIKHKPKHGMAKTKIYKTWNGIKNRTNPNNKNKFSYYKNYSGRNIKICKEWEEDFINFYNWAMANGYKEGLTIDRINNDGNYEPSNCRWVAMKKQQNNKRNNVLIEYNGETHTMAEWNEKLNYSKGLLKNRLREGWCIDRALSTPLRGRKNGN